MQTPQLAVTVSSRDNRDRSQTAKRSCYFYIQLHPELGLGLSVYDLICCSSAY